MGHPAGFFVEQPFPLFSHLAFTPTEAGDDETITVAFSPGGAVLFRVWCRRRGVDPRVSRSRAPGQAG